MSDNNTLLDDVIASLVDDNNKKNDELIKKAKEERDKLLNDDTMMQTMLEQLMECMGHNNDVIKETKSLVETTGDVDMIASYAAVAKSNSELFKVFGSIMAERIKIKSVEKIKKEELEFKKEVAVNKIGPGKETAGTTNILITAKREEIFQMLREGNLEAHKIEAPKELVTIDI